MFVLFSYLAQKPTQHNFTPCTHIEPIAYLELTLEPKIDSPDLFRIPREQKGLQRFLIWGILDKRLISQDNRTTPSKIPSTNCKPIPLKKKDIYYYKGQKRRGVKGKVLWRNKRAK